MQNLISLKIFRSISNETIDLQSFKSQELQEESWILI